MSTFLNETSVSEGAVAAGVAQSTPKSSRSADSTTGSSSVVHSPASSRSSKRGRKIREGGGFSFRVPLAFALVFPLPSVLVSLSIFGQCQSTDCGFPSVLSLLLSRLFGASYANELS